MTPADGWRWSEETQQHEYYEDGVLLHSMVRGTAEMHTEFSKAVARQLLPKAEQPAYDLDRYEADGAYYDWENLL